MAEFTSLTESSKLSEWLTRLNELSSKIDELNSTDELNKNEIINLLYDYNNELSLVQSNLYSTIVSNISRIDTTVSDQTENISNISSNLNTKLSEAINSLQNTITSELTSIKESETSYKEEIKTESDKKISELFSDTSTTQVPFNFITDVPIHSSDDKKLTEGLISKSDYTDFKNLVTQLRDFIQYTNKHGTDNTLANTIIDINSFDITQVGTTTNDGENEYANTLTIKKDVTNIIETKVDASYTSDTSINSESASKLDHNIKFELTGNVTGESDEIDLKKTTTSDSTPTIISIPTKADVFDSKLEKTSRNNYVVFNNGFKMEWGSLYGKSGMSIPFKTPFTFTPTCTISLNTSDVNSELTISYMATTEKITIYCSNTTKLITVSFSAFGVV